MAVFISVTVGLAILPACRPKPKAKPVKVRIFRDMSSPYSRELDHRMLEFQQTNPHVGYGAPIALESFQVTSYEAFLHDHLGHDETPEIVILNTPADAASNPEVQGELAHAVNVCAGLRACPADVPAFVPASLSGGSAEAAQQFLAFLQKNPG